MLRARSRRVSEHCVACLAAIGRCRKFSTGLQCGRRHGKACFHGICILCTSSGHDALKCPNMTKPSRENGVKGYKACFLWTFRGESIHEGSGLASNRRKEFDRFDRCPFKDIVRLAMGSWNSAKVRSQLIKYLGNSKLTENTTTRDFALWLI